jgi:thiol:disulfide interchange protein DsbC
MTIPLAPQGRDLRMRAVWRTAATVLVLGIAVGPWTLLQAQQSGQSKPSRSAGAQWQDDLPALANKLRAMYPTTRIDRVERAPLAGLYEVQMGKNVAYIDASGRYFLFGHVWDMRERKDLTAAHQQSLDRVDPASLPVDQAIKTVHGRGSRIVHVFADPQCGYCRQLEATLQQLADVTVYTYLLPILGPESKRWAQAIWCAPDRAQAWADWMLKQQQPPAPSAGCSAPSEALERLATGLGVAGTPMLIAADGRKHAGAMALPDLAAWLDNGSAKLARPGHADAENPVAGITRKETP